jgi:hypothetical protein
MRRPATLSHVRAVRGRFSRSVNVERDAGTDAVEGYLPTGRGLDAVRRFGRAIATPEAARALSITGPYGSGKSSLAIFLDALVSPNGSGARGIADEILLSTDPVTYELVRAGRARLKADEAGFIRAVVTAEREPVTVTVLRALDRGTAAFSSSRQRRAITEIRNEIADALRRMAAPEGAKPTAQFLHRVLERLAAVAPVLLVIDEFGKNLEAFADDPADGDLFLLQQLAEWSHGESGLPIVTVTMQHLAFDEYVGAVADSVRREWAKVQGRFEDIPYVDAPSQTRSLIGSAWEPSADLEFESALDKWAVEHHAACQRVGLGDLFPDPAQIAGCWPLHPIAQLVLPELCSRYGQNERTLFSFLASSEPLSVSSFLASTTWAPGDALPSLGVDRLYDYFVDSASTLVGAAHAASRWIEIDTLIRDAIGLAEHQQAALKTIGVLNLVSAGGALRATRQVVEYALGHASSKGSRRPSTLADLEGRGLLTFRDFADEYRLWQGSDFDLRAAIEGARRRLRTTPPATLCSRVRPLSPLVAGRHSQQTFTLRAFSRIWLDDTSASVQPPSPAEAVDGVVVYSISESSALPEVSATTEQSKPVVLVRPTGTAALLEAAIEIAAVQDVLATEERLETDWVARRELSERVAEATQRFEIEFERAFGAASGAQWMWITDRGVVDLDISTSPSAALSTVADAAYASAPRIRNEMLNRAELTSQGAKARRELLTAMLTRPADERLGIEGFGPEAAMYEAVLRGSGMHREGDERWGFAEPTAPDFLPTWAALDDEFVRATDVRIGVDQVLRRLAAPPFGVRAGVAPVLLTVALLLHSDDIAIYERGTYRPALAPDVSERMVRNPAHFELKQFATRGGVRGFVVSELASELGVRPTARPQRNSTVLGILNHLVTTLLIPLPEFSRKTSRIGQHASEVRRALLSATEPDTLLFSLLPKAVGHKPVPAKAGQRSWHSHAVWIDSLLAALQELQEAYPKLLVEIERSLVEATGAPHEEMQRALSGRIANLRTDVVDAKLRSFLTALEAPLEHEEWLVYVASTVVGSPPAGWTDDDLNRFQVTLKDLGGRFRRIEALHYDRHSGQGVPYDALRVTFTRPQGREDDRMVWVQEHHRSAIEPKLDAFLSAVAEVTGSEASARDSLLAMLGLKEVGAADDDVAPLGENGETDNGRSLGG